MKADAALNALVCQHVCLWTRSSSDYAPWKDAAGASYETPEFTGSVDVVLPWLELELGAYVGHDRGLWNVTIINCHETKSGVPERYTAHAASAVLAKAIVMALLLVRHVDID